MDRFLSIATLISALGCGLIAGLFFAFSTSVMPALARRPAAEGIAAMQAINRAILNPVFLSVFFATAVGCLLVMIATVLRWSGPESLFLLVGEMLYLVGAFGVTIACNVPRNNALERVEPTSHKAARLWEDYLREWTAWNHVRTVATLTAAALLTIGLCA